MRRLVSFLVLWTLAELPAAAGTGFWSPLGPEGAQVTALTVSPIEPEELFVASQRGGIYKSSTGGATWGLLGRGTGTEVITALAADPHQYGTAYAAGESGAVFKTVDGGGNWVRVWGGAPPDATGSSTFALVIDPRRRDTLFAGTHNGVYRSTNGGATWARRDRTLSGPVRSLAYDAASGWLYAGVDSVSNQGVFRSFDQGKTWERISAGLPSVAAILSLAFDPDRPRTLLAATTQGLYRSVDRGRRWQAVAGFSNATAVAYQRGGRAYAATSGGVFHSSDSGATWQRSANLPGRDSGDVRVLASGPDAVYAGVLGDLDGPGLYRSLDDGATWQPTVEGVQGLPVTVVAPAPSAPQTIYAAVGLFRLFKTTDGGAHWTRLPLGSPFVIYDILVDPARPDRVWVAGDTTATVLRSDNGGATWLASGNRLLFRALAFDPRASEALWAAGWQGVYHSADGGQTWEHRTPDLAGTFLVLEEIQVDPSDPNVVYAAGAGPVIGSPAPSPIVLRSADGGVTWERREAGLDGRVIDFAVDMEDPSTLYAVTDRLFRSTDAGLSWTPAPGLTGSSFLTVATAAASSGSGPGTPGAVYTAHQFPFGMVLRSTDRGQTWRPVRFNLQPAIPLVLEVDPGIPAHLLLGTQNRSLLTYTLGGSAQ